MWRVTWDQRSRGSQICEVERWTVQPFKTPNERLGWLAGRKVAGSTRIEAKENTCDNIPEYSSHRPGGGRYLVISVMAFVATTKICLMGYTFFFICYTRILSQHKFLFDMFITLTFLLMFTPFRTCDRCLLENKKGNSVYWEYSGGVLYLSTGKVSSPPSSWEGIGAWPSLTQWALGCFLRWNMLGICPD